jgi:hypothetical protein
MAIDSPKIRKRRAIKVEPYQGPRPRIESTYKYVTDPRFQRVKHRDMNIYCIYCGEPADWIAYFRTQGITQVEKYCEGCIEKYVYLSHQ